MAVIAFARNYWKYLKPIVLVGLLVSFLLVAPIQGILHSLATTNLGLFVLSLVLSLPVSYLAAITLWILARKQGIYISAWEIFKINFIIKFYSFFSPASFLGGGLRWYQLSRGGKSAEALSAVTMDRVLDVFAAVVMGLFWFLAGIRRNTVNPVALVMLITAARGTSAPLDPVQDNAPPAAGKPAVSKGSPIELPDGPAARAFASSTSTAVSVFSQSSKCPLQSV